MSAPLLAPKFEYNEAVARRFLESGGVSGGLHEFLGFETIAARPGAMQGHCSVRDELLTSFGNMHGGVLSAFCNHLLGSVCYPVNEAGAVGGDHGIQDQPRASGDAGRRGWLRDHPQHGPHAGGGAHRRSQRRPPVCDGAQGTATIMNPR